MWRRVISGIVVMLTAGLTAYYTTVHGIRLTMAGKADRDTVTAIDLRLVTIETLLRTDVARRQDLAAMRDDVHNRLTRIETLLEHRPRNGR